MFLQKQFSAVTIFFSLAVPFARAQVVDPVASPQGSGWAWSDGRSIRVAERRDGKPIEFGPGRSPAWSADGKSVVFVREHEGRDRLFLAELKNPKSARLVTDGSIPGNEESPSLADGLVVFALKTEASSDLYRVSLGADKKPEQLTKSPARDDDPSVSRDGKRVAFVSDRSGGDEIWVLPISPLADASRITFTEGDDGEPAFSPDGTRVAYSTSVSGEKWVAVVDAAGGERQLVRRLAQSPSWTADGARILAVTSPPSPPEYNGNPRRLSFADRLAIFPREAFELVELRAPEALNGGVKAAAQGSLSLAERFDAITGAVGKIYKRLGSSSAQAWQDLAARFRSRAVSTPTGAFEDVVDEMVASRPLIKPEVSSPRAVVVSAHPIATEAGLEALRRGGNVVDAAIAVSFALGVAEPDASGIGGEGMMLIHRVRDGRTVAIDFKDQVPMAATLTNPKILDGDRLVSSGPAAPNIPGVVAGMELAHKKYGSGSVKWADLIAPAIRAASEGVVLDDALPSSIEEGRSFLKRYAAAAKIYLPGGVGLRAGDTYKNPDYAETLRRIAKNGADDFYRGETARRIAEDMRKNGGVITEDDLAQYHAIEREPLRGQYGSYEIAAAPPPVSAGVSLIQTLQILDQAPRENRGRYASDASAFHYMVEAWRRAGRGNLAADPAFFALDLEEPLSLPWAQKQFAAILPRKATPDPDAPEDPEEDRDYRRDRIGTGTTAAVVMDSEGNMVALTQTLSTWGGAFYVSDGLGFLYNNHLRSFRRQPRRFNSLTPLARPATGIVPTLVFRREGDKRIPVVAVGAAGNAWISAAVYQILTGVLDAGLSPQQAVEQPRFLFGRKQFPPRQPPIPSRILYEDLIPRRVVDEMRVYGHRLDAIGLKGELVMGYASVAMRDASTGVVRAGADPRRSHQAGRIE